MKPGRRRRVASGRRHPYSHAAKLRSSVLGEVVSAGQSRRSDRSIEDADCITPANPPSSRFARAARQLSKIRADPFDRRALFVSMALRANHEGVDGALSSRDEMSAEAIGEASEPERIWATFGRPDVWLPVTSYLSVSSQAGPPRSAGHGAHGERHEIAREVLSVRTWRLTV